MRALLIDAYSGISGDMFVAAAASLARCEEEVLSLPETLGLRDVRCSFSQVIRASLSCRKFDVVMERSAAGHGHHHRPLSQIIAMLQAAELDGPTKARAVRMFQRLGAVEAALHGISVDEVEFHEVGAVDSIIDIVAAALCIERLGTRTAFCTPICVGTGVVETAHGQLPVPALATEKLLQGMQTVAGDIAGEWTTPTGALILDELQVRFENPVYTAISSSYGGGCGNPAGRPNVLRLRTVAIEDSRTENRLADEVVELRCNIDDSTGEMLGSDLVSALLNHGARDVAIYPVIMKKGRPGYVIEVLADPAVAEEMANVLMELTSTIGVRMQSSRRVKLARTSGIVQTVFGEVTVKLVQLPSGKQRVCPEYDSCCQVAERAGVAVRSVYEAALSAEMKAADRK